MNPWIERGAIWQDFHDSFLPAAREALNVQILPRYFALIQEHLYVDEWEGESRMIGIGDVSVSQPGLPDESGEGGVQTLVAPARVQQVEPLLERQISLEIRDREQRRLIAVLELLSPANKRPGRIREQYLAKRSEYLASEAHFVEIDLLRGGPRMPWIGMSRCDYCAVVSRVSQRPDAGFWPVKLRDPLPSIPVPLGEGDSDATLDLQAIVHRIYDAAGYAVHIYGNPPEPPLSAADMEWARGLLPDAL